MKKLLLTASAAVALALTAGMTPASAASANSLCEANANFGFATKAECIRFINKEAIVDACKNLLETDPVLYESLYGGTNLGACVSATRHLLKSL
jgi:hypothetical protein